MINSFNASLYGITVLIWGTTWIAISYQVGPVAPARRARGRHRRRLAKALELLVEPRLDALISGESAFRALPETLRSLYQAPAGVLCHRITYGE